MKYWVSVMNDEELERVFQGCSGKSVFLVSNFPSKNVLERVVDGILKEKPRDLTAYFLGEEIEREGLEKFDPRDESNWIPIKRGPISSPGTFMAAPLLLSERVIVLSGISGGRAGIISIVDRLFKGAEGKEIKAYSLFRPDYTIYEILGKGLIVSNSRILAEIALRETIEELKLSVNLEDLNKLVEMEPIPKDYEIIGGGKLKERIERAIMELIREKLKEFRPLTSLGVAS